MLGQLLAGLITVPFWAWGFFLGWHIVAAIRMENGVLGILAGLHAAVFLFAAYNVGEETKR